MVAIVGYPIFPSGGSSGSGGSDGGSTGGGETGGTTASGGGTSSSGKTETNNAVDPPAGAQETAATPARSRDDGVLGGDIPAGPPPAFKLSIMEKEFAARALALVARETAIADRVLDTVRTATPTEIDGAEDAKAGASAPIAADLVVIRGEAQSRPSLVDVKR